ncbi:MAG: lamin tail domain-containing protein, partial [Chloroflexi bacterium]|nr:lamin tail domain-containing protein [Chloroflexota bacterium]
MNSFSGNRLVVLLAVLVAISYGHLIPSPRAAAPSQGLLREVYTGISGLTVADLTNSAAFPNNPTSTNYLTDFEAPIDIAEQYGQRVRGYVVPPATGNYIFWISSDDGSTLYLSTDESPANKKVIASVATWTSPRQWDKEPNQTSSAMRLETGRKYYIEALMKEEGGGDNLAVRWQLPDGKIEEPIPATRLIPFGISFTPPVIVEHPTNTTAVENDAANFGVRVSNLDPVSYQWRKNDVNIPGANGSVFAYQPVTLADHGARFRCFLTNSLGTALSDEATLSVTPDVSPPLISSVLNSGSNSVTVVFSEAVGLAGATAPTNYAIDQGILVLAAATGSDSRTVVLTTTVLTYGTEYTLTVHDIQDRAATPNTVAAGLEKKFLAVEFVPIDVGNPAQAGSSTPVANGFNVVGGGGDIGGAADQFHFEYQKRSGNFDVKARVQSLGASDAWAKAGLMARESLEANSRFAASLTTPATVGCFFQSRTATGGTASAAGYFPVNFPETWLRLQRSGNLFAGYASLDGQNWMLLGSANSSLPSTVYLGLAIASRNPGQTTLAEFRDIGPVTGGVIGDFIPAREPLGPSSRRTGLVISEIMYHPQARADTNNLEFVEIFNAGLILEDLTGHRLSGALDYQFPDGTLLPAGGFLVVARVPADVQRIHGLSPVLGPYTNSLHNSSGTIRLRDRVDAVKLEANYSGAPPWPASADGAGHSLVLARPSYGESSVLAWAPSELIGGSPGTFDAIRPNPHAVVMINEFLAHTDDPQLDFIELYNHGNQTVDISGCFLTDDRGTNKFMIPVETRIPARGFVSFDQNQLGFALNAGGETLYLVNSNQTRVLDSIRFEGQANGVSGGRYPEGAPGFRPLANPTAGGPNAPWLIPPVVINEIMYHPISGNNDDEFIELYNRGPTAVDLSGWRFTDGIDFEFPTNTVLAPDGYLVIAKDAARLRSNYPNLNGANTLGDYQGNLSNSGERLALSKPDLVVTTNEFEVVETKVIYIVVEDVTYGEGGRWGIRADGGGSSLERIDSKSDPWRPSNWADSDETTKASWSTIEFTGVLDNGNSGYPPNSFQMHLLGAGECLVDDVEVFRSGSTNLISNPTVETGTTGWFMQGNHRTTSLENSGGFNGGKCLHVRTTGRGDTGANRIRSTLSNATALRSGNTATLRAKVRWLTGHPEFLLRLRGNWLEAAGAMAVPANLGTPGARNSRAVANAGPAIFDVSHSPILPAANQAVVVTTRVSDPDGLAQVVLKYRVDPSSTLSTLTLVDNGTGGDAVAGDGVYSATITGRPAATLIAFHIQATDASSPGATSKFPSDAVKSECLARWGESQPLGNLGVYRLWQTQANLNTFNSRERLANDPLDATFVYGNYRVIYNFGVRAKGSPFHGGSVGADYVFAFPDDDEFLGARDMALVTVGNLGNDDTAQREQAAFWIGKELDIPYLYRRFVHFYVNGNRKGSV